MTVFERAVVRSGIDIKYSQGFNPRPRLSLPLPRPVGVESEDELLCIKVAGGLAEFDSSDFRTSLLNQLPGGIEIDEITVTNCKKSPQPLLAVYILTLSPDSSCENLINRIEELKASQLLNVQRYSRDPSRAKTVNVRDFLKSLSIEGKMITAECAISPAGSIRVDEILQLLDLDEEKLAAPVSRKNVIWQMN